MHLSAPRTSSTRPTRPRRSRIAGLVAATGAAALAATALSSPAFGAAAAAEPVAAFDAPFDYAGAKQGAHVLPDAHNGRDELLAYRGFEGKWGRQADLMRVFVKWGTPSLLTSAQQTLAAEGRTPLVSWNSYGQGTGIRWSQVASGAYDAEIDRRATQVMEFGLPMLFTFQHEPDNQADLPGRPRAGTPLDFCNAYRHVVDRFRAAGVTNATYGVILMAASGKNGTAESFYCGGDHVEWLAADGYNWYGCVSPSGPWRLPDAIFKDWYAWGSSHGLPLIIAEWGTGEDPLVPARKGAWINALNSTVKGWSNIKAVIIFNAGVNKHCPRYSDTSPSSQAAFVAMGADPYYNQ